MPFPGSVLELKIKVFPRFSTINDLFSTHCAEERLVLVNILMEKSSPFSEPHHAEVVKDILRDHPFTDAALCNTHGQCDQIFAKVGDGRLRQ